MELLVSVRSPAEVEPALSGGADILDAKEPTRGSLGAVAPDALAEIVDRIPPHVDLSIALGDLSTPGDVSNAITRLPELTRQGRVYLKLGFASVSSFERVRALLQEATDAARCHPASPGIVAVAYADYEFAGTVPPAVLCRAAASAFVRGVLLDTYLKGRGSLFTWVTPTALSELIARAHGSGMLVALAGSLTLEHLRAVCAAGPDILGVRGAACSGGRQGIVSRSKVRQLLDQLRHMSSESIVGQPAGSGG
jgi:(5-formylfuran-3-yl)methyl phosphate synthase